MTMGDQRRRRSAFQTLKGMLKFTTLMVYAVRKEKKEHGVRFLRGDVKGRLQDVGCVVMKSDVPEWNKMFPRDPGNGFLSEFKIDVSEFGLMEFSSSIKIKISQFCNSSFI